MIRQFDIKPKIGDRANSTIRARFKSENVVVLPPKCFAKRLIKEETVSLGKCLNLSCFNASKVSTGGRKRRR